MAILFSATLAHNWPPVRPDFPRCCEAIRAAIGFAESGVLSNPFAAARTGPTAHVAPLFPAVAGMAIRAFGERPATYFALEFMAAVAVALLISVLPFAARMLGLGLASGFIAAIAYLAAGVPPFPNWEASYAALLTLALSILAVRHASDPLAMRYLAPLGLLWGVAVLTNSGTLVLYGLWLPGAGILFFRSRSGLYLRLAAALLPLLMIGAWTMRNYLILGKAIPARSNFGLELYVSNNGCSSQGMLENIKTGCSVALHPNANRQQAEALIRSGEAAYNAAKFREAVLWIKVNRDKFWGLTRGRILRFWFPADRLPVTSAIFEPGRRRFFLSVWLMTLLSAPGFLLLLRARRYSVAAVLGAWLLLFPVIYYVIQYDVRYRIPVLWVTFMLGGHFLAVLARATLMRLWGDRRWAGR